MTDPILNKMVQNLENHKAEKARLDSLRDIIDLTPGTEYHLDSFENDAIYYIGLPQGKVITPAAHKELSTALRDAAEKVLKQLFN